MSIVLALTISGCCSQQSDKEQRQEAYRNSLPERGLILLSVPDEAGDLDTDEHPARLLPAARELIQELGAGVYALPDMIWLMALDEPDHWSQDERTLWWGPYQDEFTPSTGDVFWLWVRGPPLDSARPDSNSDTGITVDSATERAFPYTFGVLRALEADFDDRAQIMWGGSNPDAGSDHLVQGVLIWDFDASNSWEVEHNPVVMRVERGRIVLAWAISRAGGAGRDDDAQTERRVVTAAFRNFLPRQGAPMPISLDQAWGEREDAASDGLGRYHFYNIGGQVNLDLDLVDVEESGTARMTLAANGAARFEAQGQLGNIALGSRVDVFTCWGDRGQQQYLRMDLVSLYGGGTTSVRPSEGEEAACDIATLAHEYGPVDLPADVRAVYDTLVSHGVPRYAD